MKAQWPELVLGQFAREKSPRLVAKLGDALVDKTLIVIVVAVHAARLPARPYSEKECVVMN